ncbi:MAG: diaminopimelate epimerase [Acidimicrobiales bacterium]|nr:diaminopimelate epimerase [Acidimicrobiales bacterium]
MGALLSLTKHHGLGNDFLVLLDPDDRHPLRTEVVAALCDRHRGVGADGLVRGHGRQGNASANPVDLAMDLRNADGCGAEMSGNGIACLAQAAVDAGWTGPDLLVATAAGPKAVRVRPGRDAAESAVSVSMGTPEVGRAGDFAPDDGGPPVSFRGWPVVVGNPHLVLVCEDPDRLASLDVAGLGSRYQGRFPGGVNVEWVAPAAGAGPSGNGTGRLMMRVFERGVGETLACGTGSVAAAAALSHLRAGDGGPPAGPVRVSNPGGDLLVDVSGPEAVLTTAVCRVARIEVDEAWLRP